jgi:hypothetical protein
VELEWEPPSEEHLRDHGVGPRQGAPQDQQTAHSPDDKTKGTSLLPVSFSVDSLFFRPTMTSLFFQSLVLRLWKKKPATKKKPASKKKTAPKKKTATKVDWAGIKNNFFPKTL